MARLTQLSDELASSDALKIFGAIDARIGMVPNLYRVAANQPAVLRGLLGLNDELANGAFDAHTREAIALAVAGANGCDYCEAAHSTISRNLKMKDVEIDAYLAARADEPRLAAILTLAVSIVAMQGRIDDDELTAAREAGLPDAEIVETVGNVVVNIFTNYLNHVAQTDIDFPVKHVSR